MKYMKNANKQCDEVKVEGISWITSPLILYFHKWQLYGSDKHKQYISHLAAKYTGLWWGGLWVDFF